MDNISNNLKRQVLREANNLKKYATKEELQRLNIELLVPKFQTACIYGQMTGDCYSPRASELIHKCAVPVAAQPSVFYLYPVRNWVRRWWRGITGYDRGNYRLFTAIEAYITAPGAKNHNLIKYLRGETQVLKI